MIVLIKLLQFTFNVDDNFHLQSRTFCEDSNYAVTRNDNVLYTVG